MGFCYLLNKGKLIKYNTNQFNQIFNDVIIEDITIIPDDELINLKFDNQSSSTYYSSEESVDKIGDSLIHSEKFEELLKNTYSSDFSDEFEYADNIINWLISDYEGTAIEDELVEYLKDVYGETLMDLYRSGDDSDNDGDDDLEYFV